MKKTILTILCMLMVLGVVACDTTPQPPVEDNKVTLVDLAGKTEAEIIELYEGKLNIQFIYKEDNNVSTGTFIKYSQNRNIGDKVDLNTTVRIEIAGKKPTIYGIEDVELTVTLPNSEPTFDPTEGISAVNYLGNEIPFGAQFFILGYLDKEMNPITSINYYSVGTYYIKYRANDAVTKLYTESTRKITINSPEFDTRYTDDLDLTADYEGKSFIDDGIGEVVVASLVDGDTTNFRDLKSTTLSTRFTVRYLGIDTPEATSSFEPWGIPAAAFVREKLSTADKVILQAEAVGQTDGNDRYLAWVWYVKDGETRLLNLELIEQAYATTSGALSTQYGEILAAALQKTLLTGKRVHGETDPDFDYSTSGVALTIDELLNDFDTYSGKKKVALQGVVTLKIGNSFYLESGNVGIYIFGGYNPTEVSVGDEVVIQGLMPSYFPQDSPGKQVSNYKNSNMTVVSTGNSVTVHEITIDNMSQYVGRIVRLNNLTITSIDKTETGTYAPYSIIAKDSNGKTVNIRVDASQAAFIPANDIVVGSKINVYGPVNQFYSNYQLMLAGRNYIEFL